MLGDKLKDALQPLKEQVTTQSLSSTLTKFKPKSRQIKLNNRGMKIDELTSNNLKKDYRPFESQYSHNFRESKIENLAPSIRIQSQEPPTKQQKPKEDPLPVQEDLQQKTKPTEDELTPSSTLFLIDQIPPNDPIWAQLVPENILKDPNINLEKLIEENYDYFYNLLGLWLQEREQSDFNMQKLSSQHRMRTLYGRDFQSLDFRLQQTQPLNCKTYESPKNFAESLHMRSQYQTSFQKDSSKPIDQVNFKPIYVKNEIPMSLMTTYKVFQYYKIILYKQNFYNWKNNTNISLKVNYNMSTGQLPFLATSTYRKSFTKSDGQFQSKLESMKNQYSKLGPFFTSGNMIYTNSIQQERSKNQEKLHSLTESAKQKQIYENTPAFRGQFTSTAQRDFRYNSQQQDPEIKKQLNKKLWKQKIIEKLNQLRSQQ